MNKILGVDDALAVDLLMDRSMNKTGTQAVTSFVAPVGDEVVRRVGAVESLLRLIAEMPAEEVPVGLAQRTIEHVRHFRQHGTIAPAAQQQAVIGQGPQHA